MSENTAKIINEKLSEQVISEINKGIIITDIISELIIVNKSIDNYYVSDNGISGLAEIMLKNSNLKDLFLVFSKDGFKSSDRDSAYSFEYSLHKSPKGINSKIFDVRDFQAEFAEFYSLTDDKDIIVSDPFWQKFSNQNELVVTIFKPIYDKNVIIGAIGINYSLNEVINITEDLSYNKEYIESYILSDNIIVASSGKDILSGKNILQVEGEEHTIYNYILSNNFEFSSYKDLAGAYIKKSSVKNIVDWEFITVIPYNIIIKGLINNIYVSIFIAALIMLVGLILIIIFIKRSFSPFNAIINAAEKISRGELIKLKNVYTNKNEFGNLINSFNNISENLKEASHVSSEIASGNYTIKMTPKSENDILAVSINRIAENMHNTSEKSILQEEKTSQQLWMRRGRFEVAETERKSENNIEDLTFNLIRKIVKYTDAALGGIYLFDEDDNSVDLIAAYAYGNRKLLKRKYKAGEGLAGACLVEKKKIIMNKIPDDYIKVSSGLGSGAPGFLVLIPVFFQEKINSIIEIAYLSKPKDYIIEFIERLSDNIGAWIDASVTNSKTVHLLEVSKDQTQELALKEKELNLKVEELEKFQAEIAVQNAEFISMMNAVNNTVMTVEYTLEGIVINSNQIYEKIMGFSIQDIKGVNVLELVKDQQTDLLKIIQQVAEGISVKRQVKRYTKSGEIKWLSATYTPYFDKDGNITRVLFFAFDITEMKIELDNMKS